MNFIKKFMELSLFVCILLSISCGKDDATPAKSREIKFEVTGTF